MAQRNHRRVTLIGKTHAASALVVLKGPHLGGSEGWREYLGKRIHQYQVLQTCHPPLIARTLE